MWFVVHFSYKCPHMWRIFSGEVHPFYSYPMKTPEKMQFIPTDLGNETRGGACMDFCDDETRELVKICFCLLSSALFDLSRNKIEPRGCCSEWRKPPGSHLFPPSDRRSAYGGCTYCSALFELEYLQFSLRLYPSLFRHRSQTLTLIWKPECCSVKIFTGRIVHNVFMHNENACEGYYSNSNKIETDYGPRLCLGMGSGESHIAALSAEHERKSDPVTYRARHLA